MLKKGLILLVALVFFGCDEVTVNNLGSVEGTVTDSSTGGLLAGVTVKIGEKSNETGESGVFSVSKVSVGTRTITASKDGYEIYSENVEVLKDTTVNHNIKMTSAGGASVAKWDSFVWDQQYIWE